MGEENVSDLERKTILAVSDCHDSHSSGMDRLAERFGVGYRVVAETPGEIIVKISGLYTAPEDTIKEIRTEFGLGEGSWQGVHRHEGKNYILIIDDTDESEHVC